VWVAARSELAIIDVFERAAVPAAMALIREYVVITAEEQQMQLSALPYPIENEVDDRRSFYAPPGTVLVATQHEKPIGCVALRAASATSARCGVGTFVRKHGDLALRQHSCGPSTRTPQCMGSGHSA